MAYHLQKPSAGMIVLRIFLQVLRELFDLTREHGNLHFGRTGIFLVTLMFADNAGLDAPGKHCVMLP